MSAPGNGDGRLSFVIPVKPLDEGKSRLAGVLSPEARGLLTLTLLDRTLIDGPAHGTRADGSASAKRSAIP